MCQRQLQARRLILTQLPTKTVEQCTVGGTPAKKAGEKGKKDAAVMTSPEDPLLKHVGGADMSQ